MKAFIEYILPWVELVGGIMTVIALRLSWRERKQAEVQRKLAEEQTQLAKIQTSQLEAIAKNLTTKYVGEFPDYMNEVGALIDEAKSGLIIACTTPAHVMFTNQKAWFSVKQAIERVSHNGIPIRCIFSTPEGRQKLWECQISADKLGWNEWRSTYLPQMTGFLQTSGSSAKAEEITRDELFQLFHSRCSAETETTFRRSTVKLVKGRLPLYMWIVNRKKAIIAMVTTSSDKKGQAFITSDRVLVEALVQMFEEDWKKEDLS